MTTHSVPTRRVSDLVRRQRRAPEREQDSEHQADGNAETQIFRDGIGEHPPDDTDRSALTDDEVEQPQHLLQKQQHRRQHQGRQQIGRATSELQSLMRISYAVFCLKKKQKTTNYDKKTRK